MNSNNARFIARINICIALDRHARDRAMEAARYLRNTRAPNSHVFQAVRMARIHNRTAIERAHIARAMS